MPGWKIQPTLKVDLPEDIADGLWISIHHPKMLPFEVVQKMTAMQTDANADNFDLNEAVDMASALIIDWNLPSTDGHILKTPKDDPEVWKKIPTMPVIQTVFGALNNGVATSIPDPNSSGGSANS